MKQIIIKSMALTNFKGIKNLELSFEELTDIFGANATGKTTIFDAFTWGLFGKDSSERKDFEIKTLDKFGKVIPEIEHEVSVQLLVENETISIRRILKENWVKKRGGESPEFKGNVSEFYWNDVPVNLTEFNKKVSDVLDENVFKIITSPTYFNSIKWQERRKLLIDIFEEVSNEDIAKGNSAYESLLSKLTQGKTLEDYKNQISASIKKAKDDLKNIPSRIDEVFRGKPIVQDFDALQKELDNKNKSLEKIDEQIGDINKAYGSKLGAQRDKKLKASNLKSDIEIIEQNARNEANKQIKPDTSVLDGLNKEKQNIESEISSYESALATQDTKFKGLKQEIKNVSDKMDTKRNEWASENSKTLTFNDNDFHCPTCKREFESGDVETKKSEALQNFNKNKQTKLNEINQEGGNLKTQKGNLEKELEGVQNKIDEINSNLNTSKQKLEDLKPKIEKATPNSSTDLEKPDVETIYQALLSSNEDYKTKSSELKTITDSIEEIPTVDNSELTEKRKGLVSEIDEIKSKLQSKAQIEAADKRIGELKTEQTTLAQQIANVEKEQFVIENFIKDKVDALENVVNSKFKYVKFKMFDEQINGGLKETCEATVNGVPYSDVNTASRINAGLDIINVLSEFYGVCAPIFVDNAESVHTLIDTKSQLIRLVVSEDAKKLTVFNTELVA